MYFIVLFPSIVIATIRIQISRDMNRFEIFCEWILSLAIIICSGFTDWESAENQYMIGWMFNGVIIIGLCATASQMVQTAYHASK